MVVLQFLFFFSPTSIGCEKLEEEEKKRIFFLALLYKGLRGLKFWVLNLGLPHDEKPNTMYHQCFLISSCSIRCVLGMPQLEAYIPSFSPEVQALTRVEIDIILTSLFGAFRSFPFYIPIVGFSKPAWPLATFLTYSFYSSTHQTLID